MNVISNPSNFLLSGQTASAYSSPAMDTRAGYPSTYIMYVAGGSSAVVSIQASHDGAGWMPVATYTATTTTATAQTSAYYPFVRAQVNACYSAAGGTGSAYLYYGIIVQ